MDSAECHHPGHATLHGMLQRQAGVTRGEAVGRSAYEEAHSSEGFNLIPDSGLQGDQAASLLLAEARDVGVADIARAARLVLDLVGGTVSLIGATAFTSAP